MYTLSLRVVKHCTAGVQLPATGLVMTPSAAQLPALPDAEYGPVPPNARVQGLFLACRTHASNAVDFSVLCSASWHWLLSQALKTGAEYLFLSIHV